MLSGMDAPTTLRVGKRGKVTRLNNLEERGMMMVDVHTRLRVIGCRPNCDEANMHE